MMHSFTTHRNLSGRRAHGSKLSFGTFQKLPPSLPVYPPAGWVCGWVWEVASGFLVQDQLAENM